MLLKKAIRRRGQNNKEFAAEMGVDPSYMSGINSGRIRPGWTLAQKIGAALNINPLKIWGYKDSLTDSAL